MRCGLFGKLQGKRDFVTLSVPRGFLRVWEPWLEQGLIESRRQMGPAEWREAFAEAPTWRFWLGEGICGKIVLGAMMPSLDACGRMFPLTLIGVAESTETILPPVVDPHWVWFERADAALAAARNRDTPFDATQKALADLSRLPVVGDQAASAGPDPLPAPQWALQQMFARLAEPAANGPLASTTFFWTIGSPSYEPAALRSKSLPAPIDFSRLLTQQFPPAPEPSPDLEPSHEARAPEIR